MNGTASFRRGTGATWVLARAGLIFVGAHTLFVGLALALRTAA